ncbi:MAG: hypothetical protein Q7J80_05935 [Anaerolineales bacterium]|nr:hypothetical protein [Anaerolineales bacterium]
MAPIIPMWQLRQEYGGRSAPRLAEKPKKLHVKNGQRKSGRKRSGD